MYRVQEIEKRVYDENYQKFLDYDCQVRSAYCKYEVLYAFFCFNLNDITLFTIQVSLFISLFIIPRLIPRASVLSLITLVNKILTIFRHTITYVEFSIC